jgi:ABC-2 type transport system permease protein
MTESNAVRDEEVVLAVAIDEPLRLSRLPSLRGLFALFVLALRQQVRGWRLVVLALLFLLPGALAVTIHLTSPGGAGRVFQPGALEFDLIHNLIAHALAPLAALLCTAGIIRDEIEEQTLTYVLLRPLPRTAVYAVKLLAALVIVAALTASFSVATAFLIAGLQGRFDLAVLLPESLKIAAIVALTQIAYCGVFALLGLLLRRSLIIGVAYIVLFEGILASFDTLARRLTVMYYYRVLVIRWLSPPDPRPWVIDMTKAASAENCALILLGAGVVLAALGAVLFASREFRMKTPGAE